MSSTNKTTHYELSQYTASDKPTYLVDYNGDMNKIDTGIYEAKSEADTNTAAIGTLSSLSTTEKTNLVGAINEVDGDVSTLSGTVGQHTTDIASNTSAIGNLTNLNTTAKSNLVAATNEVNNKVNNFNLTDFDTCTVTSGSATVTLSEINVSCSKNSDGSLFKIYGGFRADSNTWDSGTDITINNTGLPSINQADEYDIYGAVLIYRNEGIIKTVSLHYNANGSLTFNTGGFGASDLIRIYLPPCLYFNANFGDTPE